LRGEAACGRQVLLVLRRAAGLTRRTLIITRLLAHHVPPSAHPAGREWIVEAYGCDPVRLADPAALRALFNAIVHELSLHPVGEAAWHQFPAPGGLTGLLMLAESHLTVHTFPEHASACLNLFCCTPRAPWAWEARLAALLGAETVCVRELAREYAHAPLSASTIGEAVR
jgi:S-adenosylmethionine decarboxylase